jgi:hypothetical protein
LVYYDIYFPWFFAIVVRAHHDSFQTQHAEFLRCQILADLHLPYAVATDGTYMGPYHRAAEWTTYVVHVMPETGWQ